jgi:hypothetical protein
MRHRTRAEHPLGAGCVALVQREQCALRPVCCCLHNRTSAVTYLVFVLSSSLDAELLTLLIVVKGVKGPRPDSFPCSNYLMYVPFILDQRFHIALKLNAQIKQLSRPTTVSS